MTRKACHRPRIFPARTLLTHAQVRGPAHTTYPRVGDAGADGSGRRGIEERAPGAFGPGRPGAGRALLSSRDAGKRQSDQRLAASVLHLIAACRQVLLAETVGFEPTMQVLPAYSLSRGAPSASRSRLRARCGDSSPPLVSRGRGVAAQATCGASSSKARCNARTASSMYFSSITTEVLI